jgi:lipopolysaccharide transport system ATP-binding protein
MLPALRIEHLSKSYPAGWRPAGYRTLRESLGQLLNRPWHRSPPGSEFWALRDLSFEVQPGEVVGVIGRNGAGKSTLLRILSRVTEPTQGRVEMRGRVGSLLEVGTGFHPELTGRENIFLNGAILGMRRHEILRHFDEIVAFAELESFLELPVKRYSSGMRMRLGFSVAYHFRPDILLLDEILAVGDASFQRKCVQRMETVGAQGQTVLFVSHDLNAVARLCPRTILLADGKLCHDGPTAEVIHTYLRSGLGLSACRDWPTPEQAPGNEQVRLRAVRVLNAAGQVSATVDIRQPIQLEIVFEVLQPGRVVPILTFRNEEGLCVFQLHDLDPAWRGKLRPVGRYCTRAVLPGNLLAEGMLLVGVTLTSPEAVLQHVQERDAVAFQVVDSLEGDSARGDYSGTMPGLVRPLVPWHTDFAPLS